MRANAMKKKISVIETQFTGAPSPKFQNMAKGLLKNLLLIPTCPLWVWNNLRTWNIFTDLSFFPRKDGRKLCSSREVLLPNYLFVYLYNCCCLLYRLYNVDILWKWADGPYSSSDSNSLLLYKRLQRYFITIRNHPFASSWWHLE